MNVRYDALAVKARAMYGRRVRREDLKRITDLRSIDDIADELRQLSGWAEATASLPAGQLLTRATLESALRAQVRREGLRLAAFVPQKDRPIMDFPIVRSELELIMAALRRLHASMFKEVEPLPEAYLTHTRVDPEGLRRCTDFAGLLEAVKGSIYYAPLSRLQSDEGTLPDYGVTEALLSSVYYRHILELIRKQYDGPVRRVLEASVGIQVDMLNIMHVLRLKRYFPEEDNYLPVLLPFHHKLRPEQLRAMCAAPDADAVMELVEATPYADTFRGAKPQELHNLYSAALYKFSRRQLVMGKPSIYSAIAYMNLREIELKAVVAAVEASKYRLTLDPTFLQILEGGT